MSHVTENQPAGTPTWMDLRVPDLDKAMAFYGPLLGWEFQVGPVEAGRYTICLLDGRRVAGILPVDEPGTEVWTMYFATDDIEATLSRITEAGGTIAEPAKTVGDLGTFAVAVDPVGATFGLWRGGTLPGCETVNEPGALVRNDLVTPAPEPARAFYCKLFGFTLDGNEDLPGMDFTFLRRPDGHEIGGVAGMPDAQKSFWGTAIEVADTDVVANRAQELGGKATDPEDTPYVRSSTITDPFGNHFDIGARP